MYVCACCPSIPLDVSSTEGQTIELMWSSLIHWPNRPPPPHMHVFPVTPFSQRKITLFHQANLNLWFFLCFFPLNILFACDRSASVWLYFRWQSKNIWTSIIQICLCLYCAIPTVYKPNWHMQSHLLRSGLCLSVCRLFDLVCLCLSAVTNWQRNASDLYAMSIELRM